MQNIPSGISLATATTDTAFRSAFQSVIHALQTFNTILTCIHTYIYFKTSCQKLTSTSTPFLSLSNSFNPPPTHSSHKLVVLTHQAVANTAGVTFALVSLGTPTAGRRLMAGVNMPYTIVGLTTSGGRQCVGDYPLPLLLITTLSCPIVLRKRSSLPISLPLVLPLTRLSISTPTIEYQYERILQRKLGRV